MLKSIRLKNITQRIHFEGNELTKIKQKCSSVRAESRQLARKIDALREERLIFEKYYEKLVSSRGGTG